MKKLKKLKAVKKEEKVEPTYYATLSEEQFDKIERFSWDNPLDELKSIAEDGDSSMIEIGFKLGDVYRKFKLMLDEIEQIMEQVKPEEETTDWDSEVDYSEDEEN